MRTARFRRLLGAALTGVGAGALGVGWLAGRSRPPSRHSGPPDPPAGLPPGRVVAVPGHGELFVRDAPAERDGAPTLLLLHGWMFPSDLNWLTSYEPLRAVGRVLAVDHRGHGRGTRPSEPFRLVDVADDCAALLRTLQTGPVVAVGYSMGGPIAQLLWQRHPDLVDGLVLCATPSTLRDVTRYRAMWRAMGLLQLGLRLLPRAWYEGIARAQARGQVPRLVTRMIHQGTPREVVDRLPWVIGELARGSAEDLAEAGRELGRFDSRGWCPSIDVPTAVVVTAADGLVPPDCQRDLAARIPHARRFEVEANHDGIVAAAESFVPTLVEAIDGVLQQARRRSAVS